MSNSKDISCFYLEILSCLEKNSYKIAITKIRDYISFSDKPEDLAFAYLSCGFLNNKLKKYSTAIDDFSKSIYYDNLNNNFNNLSKDIAYNGRSESKYKCCDFKGAIDDKRQARKIRFLEEINSSSPNDNKIDYKRMLNSSFDGIVLDIKYQILVEMFKSNNAKYDLINDYKKVINDNKKKVLINNLEKRSDEKFKIGDYKAAIRAIRRSEKYY